ncbi:MAG TPA: hypothetical protein VNX18_21320 [Bryobacteraceae bacterium]|nr:hypothetical protein [Bryobacteraceae bacterium]
MLPLLSGRPILVEMRPSLGPHLAAASIPDRRILLDREVLTSSGEFERILIHEIFHFAWLRLSNAKRREWESVLQAEVQNRVRGELGWSAEWRKEKLTSRDPVRRSPVWRRYACESFCDTAAWLYSGVRLHDEFTLPAAARSRRRRWFQDTFPATQHISI